MDARRPFNSCGWSVAAVAAAAAGWIPLLLAKMIAQLRAKRPLNQRLLQLLESRSFHLTEDLLADRNLQVQVVSLRKSGIE
jgi:hypothetical protein